MRRYLKIILPIFELMRAKSISKFSVSNFIFNILASKVSSFSELDDQLVSDDIKNFIKTDEDRKKLKKLLKSLDNRANKTGTNTSFEEKFSNGQTLYIK